MKKWIQNTVITVFLGLMALAFFVSGLCIFTEEKNSFPPEDLYFARHNSYLSWTDKQYNPHFVLQLYEVKGGKSFLDYAEMRLQDSEGNDFELKDAGIQTIYSDMYFSSYRITCILDRNKLKAGQTVFKQAVLLDKEGKAKAYPIGDITLWLGESNGKNELQFSSGTTESSILNSYNIQVANISSESVRVTEIFWSLSPIELLESGYYDSENRYFRLGDGVTLESGESIVLHCKMEGDDALRQSPFTELQPLIRYISDGENHETAVTNKATYFAKFTRTEIKEYLWEIYKSAVF